MNAKILKLQADMYAVIAEIEGMKADNLQREHLGEGVAWDGVCFRECADDLRMIAANATAIIED